KEEGNTMHQQGLAKMMEATRLVREGKLSEATALLQGGPDQQRAEPPRAWPAQADPARSSVPYSGVFPGGLRGSPSLESLLSRLPRSGRMPPFGSVAKPPSPELPGRWLEGSYANAAGKRDYRLYVPSGHRVGQPVPLLTMLHGGTQTADDFAAGTRMNEWAERHTFLVVYPEQSAAANPMRYWNWFQPAHQHRGTGEPSLLAGLTSHISTEYALDATRVYVAGFSAGAAMAAVLAACYADVYAAVGVHSGLAHGVATDVPSAFHVMKHGAPSNGRGDAGTVPLIVFHGDGDPTVNLANADCLVERRLRSGGKRSVGGQPQRIQRQVPGGHQYTRAVFSDLQGTPLVEQWTIHGGGHAWSGGSPLGSYTDPLGPDASAELVRFFGQQVHAGVRKQRPHRRPSDRQGAQHRSSRSEERAALPSGEHPDA
ncbi:MAG TPA: PHB depolymerase family esterase, partial [Polyangiaceae bacterium]|nr:PHB depolymerase family esterase [Polyangiaceae bacterium]